jgi:hypothetical protein
LDWLPEGLYWSGLRKRRPALTKIIAVLFKSLTRLLEKLRYSVIGVGGDRL